MDIHIPAPLRDHPRNMIRRAGYAEFRDPNTGETSYVRRLQSGVFYPRFHVYLKERQDGVVVSLHLDQKKPSYGHGAAHSGEYEGTTVVQEMARIQGSMTAQDVPTEGVEEEKGAGFFSRLFGR
jgi:hypothetical protein